MQDAASKFIARIEALDAQMHAERQEHDSQLKSAQKVGAVCNGAVRAGEASSHPFRRRNCVRGISWKMSSCAQSSHFTLALWFTQDLAQLREEVGELRATILQLENTAEMQKQNRLKLATSEAELGEKLLETIQQLEKERAQHKRTQGILVTERQVTRTASVTAGCAPSERVWLECAPPLC